MKRFQRPVNEYAGAEGLLYRDKYQQDSNSVPKIAISSAKIDGDFNYLLDAVNTLDEDVKSSIHSGIANETILEKHIAINAISEKKLAESAVTSRAIRQGCITNAKLSDLAVTTPKIANNSVTKDKMSSESVGTDEIIDKSITKDKLAPDAISDSVPVGTIAQFSVNKLPTGWLLCTGAVVSKNTYPQLVKFLTGSDTTLEATLPSMSESKGIKFAIKAFSDVAQLATLEIAGLTQNVAKNTAEVAKKADKFAESIAEGAVLSSRALSKSRGVKMLTRLNDGRCKIYLNDNLKGKNFKLYSMAKNWGAVYATNYDYVNGTVEISTTNYNMYNTLPFDFIIFETKEA